MTISVLHVLPTLFAHGGTPRKLLSLAAHGSNTEIRHHFLVYCNQTPNLVERIRETRCEVIEKPRPHNWDVRLINDIIRVAKKRDIHIINTHFARSDIFGAVAGAASGIPIIKSVHGIAWNDSRLFQLMDRIVAPMRAMTVCNSIASAQAETSRSGVTAPLEVIYNGVPNPAERDLLPADQLRQELRVPHNAPLIMHIGGLIPLRNQWLLIDAVSLLKQQGVNVYLAILGDGPEKENLCRRVAENNIEDCVRMPGYVAEASRFLPACDIYVNPAESEGFGIAVVEAMLMSKAVVLAEAGALPELIDNGRSGLLFTSGSTSALATKIRRLLDDIVLRENLGRRAHEHASEHFSMSRFCSQFTDLYSRVAQLRST